MDEDDSSSSDSSSSDSESEAEQPAKKAVKSQGLSNSLIYVCLR